MLVHVQKINERGHENHSAPNAQKPYKPAYNKPQQENEKYHRSLNIFAFLPKSGNPS